MLLQLLSIEIRKTIKHPALWGGLGVLLCLLGAFTLLRHLQTIFGYRPTSGGIEQDLLAGLAFFKWIGILIYGVTASVIAGFDYPDRSIQLWLTRGVPRTRLLLARLITILLFSLLLVCFSVIVIMAFAALSRALFFGIINVSNLNPSKMVAAVLRLFWASLPYLALTALLAVISRSPVFAAGGLIIYGSVFEPLAARWSNRFPILIRYLPAQLSQVLQSNNGALDRTAPLPLDASIMPEAHAILFIGLLFVALSSISFVLFSRQDLGG